MPDKLILFDGECGLCHAWVRFVIRHDRNHVFHFASMNSDTGQSVLALQDSSPDNIDTMLYIEQGVIFDKSRAFIRVVGQLSFPVKLLVVIVVVPRVIRDFVYDQIATRRYRWFGKAEECLLTAGEHQDRFV